MDDYQSTPSIIDREIRSFRGGPRLAYGDLTGREKRDYLFDTGDPGHRLRERALGPVYLDTKRLFYFALQFKG